MLRSDVLIWVDTILEVVNARKDSSRSKSLYRRTAQANQAYLPTVQSLKQSSEANLVRYLSTVSHDRLVEKNIQHEDS